MTTQQCTRCVILAELVQKQQAEIQRLRMVIAQTKGVCLNIASSAQQVMKKGGIPRASYGYKKAEFETASRISKFLSGE